MNPNQIRNQKLDVKLNRFLREDKWVEEKHLESDNGRREVESENLGQVQQGSVVIEAEFLDKSMDVAKEIEASSDDVGLSES